LRPREPSTFRAGRRSEIVFDIAEPSELSLVPYADAEASPDRVVVVLIHERIIQVNDIEGTIIKRGYGAVPHE